MNKNDIPTLYVHEDDDDVPTSERILRRRIQELELELHRVRDSSRQEAPTDVVGVAETLQDFQGIADTLNSSLPSLESTLSAAERAAHMVTQTSIFMHILASGIERNKRFGATTTGLVGPPRRNNANMLPDARTPHMLEFTDQVNQCAKDAGY